MSAEPMLPVTPTDEDIEKYVAEVRAQQGLPRFIEGYGLQLVLDLLVGPVPSRRTATTSDAA